MKFVETKSAAAAREQAHERTQLAAVNRLWQQARKVLAPPKE
jgi:hypothetical protein